MHTQLFEGLRTIEHPMPKQYQSKPNYITTFMRSEDTPLATAFATASPAGPAGGVDAAALLLAVVATPAEDSGAEFNYRFQ